jgi:SsrA-binding protein
VARAQKDIARNKKAFHDYHVDETLEAGLVLKGTEVKSLRENGASLRESYALIRDDEAWLMNVHIAPYSHGDRDNPDPTRARKLLLHKRQIRYLLGKVKEKGYTLVPLKMYFSEGNMVKVEIGLAKGKKLFDKRRDIAERDSKRDAEREMRERQKDGW